MSFLCGRDTIVFLSRKSLLSSKPRFACCRMASSQATIRFQKHVDPNNAPLTLDNLRFRPKINLSENRQTGGIQEFPPHARIKRLREAKPKVVRTKDSHMPEVVPFAAKSFSELNLSPLLMERLKEVNFTAPTDIQSTAIPTICQNHDVIIQSCTGSGKTLAYLLPILSEVGPLKKLSEVHKYNQKPSIEAVVIAPSRELGMQIVREVENLFGAEHRRLVQQLVGGANGSRQEEGLKKNKPVIVVGTPGRIAEIISAGKFHARGCHFLVMDEIDVLLSSNFRDDINRILEHVGTGSRSGPARPNDSHTPGAERQIIMVSATVPSYVRQAANRWGKDPLLVRAKDVLTLEEVPLSGTNLTSTSSSDIAKLDLVNHGAVESLPPSLKHYYCVAKAQHKVDMLRKCIHALDARSVITFLNYSKRLKDVMFKLETRGMMAVELHGDLGKLVRSTTLKRFKDGEVRVLVTNELSARGLDVVACDLVVNLELPTDFIHYAHRAGRTGRLGREGSVVSICEVSEVFIMKKMSRQLGVEIKACEFAGGKLLINKEKL